MASILNRKAFILIGLALILGVVAGFLLLRRDPSASTSHTTSRPVIATNALFSFNASKAPDWNQGPTNKTSLALFKKDTGCFASVEVKNGVVDETQALSKITAGFSDQGYGVTTLDPITTDFAIDGAPSSTSYTLHPYSLSGTGQGDYKTQVFGYVPLENRYITVEAYCSDNTTFSQIVDTLSAISLKAQ